jgi:hypothetical protein
MIVIKVKTARCLCSVTLSPHNMNGSVKHQAEPMCTTPSGTAHSQALRALLVRPRHCWPCLPTNACRPNRTPLNTLEACDNFLYGFKGAPSARQAIRPSRVRAEERESIEGSRELTREQSR